MNYYVGVYLVDRAYGGPEEGGWWYNYGDLVRILRRFKSEDRAYEYCRRLNVILDKTLNKNRRPISSVLSEGQYEAGVYKNDCPKSFPERAPHYE